MRICALVLLCLDFLGLGRRLRSVKDRPQEGSMQVLARLLLVCETAEAWQVTGAERFCSPIFRSPAHELAGSCCSPYLLRRSGHVLLVAANSAVGEGTMVLNPETFARMEEQMQVLYDYPQAETHQLLQTLAKEFREKDAVAAGIVAEIAQLFQKLDEHQLNKDRWYTVVDEKYEERVYEQMRELRRRVQAFVQLVQGITELRTPLSSDPLEVIKLLGSTNVTEKGPSQVTLSWDSDDLARMEIQMEAVSGNSPDAETERLFQVLVGEARKGCVLANHMLGESADLTKKLNRSNTHQDRWWPTVVDKRQSDPRYKELRLLRGRIERLVQMVETIRDLRSQQLLAASEAIERSAILKARQELARLTEREADDTVRRDLNYYLQFFKTTFRWSPILLQEVTKVAAYDTFVKPLLDAAAESAKKNGVRQDDLDKVRDAIERVGEVVARKSFFLYPEELSEILETIVRLVDAGLEGGGSRSAPLGESLGSRGSESDDVNLALRRFMDVGLQRLSLRQEELDELRAAVDQLADVLRRSTSREVAGQLKEVSRELKRVDDDTKSQQ